MVLTRSFKQTVRERISKDAAFRRALLREATEAMRAGGVNVGKSILSDYINRPLGISVTSTKPIGWANSTRSTR